MFEFGRDLRKLFEKARESDDLGWLELISADLVEAEAGRESVDAGRVSCARPFDAAMRASTLWREHAHRAGRRSSLDRAARAASDAARLATTVEQTAAVAIEAGEIHLLKFDLFGGPEALTAALSDSECRQGERPVTRALAASLHARLTARRSRLSGDAGGMLDAAALLDAAIHDTRSLPSMVGDVLRLDRAALALEAGVTRRDPRLLDQAGRDLRALVEASSPDQRPLTRARALALAGTGLKALARLANDDVAMAQGRALFDAAADQFTPDHSPLDWATIQLARGDDETPLMTLAQVESLTREPGLLLGALARERRQAAEIALAEAMADVEGLKGMHALMVRRLSVASTQPLDWAADQIILARIAMAVARLSTTPAKAVGLMLAEAIETAREHGAPALVERAVLAMPEQGRGSTLAA